MRRTVRAVAIAATAVVLSTTGVAITAAQATPASTLVSRVETLLHPCGAPATGKASCLAVVRAHRLTYSNGTVTTDATTAAPAGYAPADLQAAYKLPSATAGTGQTVAIVDAYDDPTAEADLGVYRSQFGLSDCTTANGCFRKVNQTGGTTPPTVDTGWAQEESLDVDMVSAIAPNAHILLVEANSASFADLAAAENEAVALGATEVSNSYGGSESRGETAYNSAYNHRGVAITVSAGDSGYGAEFPAAAPTVTAVGGTSLKRAANARGWTETVWGSGGRSVLTGGTGSGCSGYEAKPSWQRDAGCAKRTIADVAAVADPNTGVAVYDSTADSSGDAGWMVFGGTSVGSPVIAGVYALAGNAATVNAAGYAYSHTSSLFDVTSGSNGTCGGLFTGGSAKKYLCTARAGYDGPTGLGTPKGTGAF